MLSRKLHIPSVFFCLSLHLSLFSQPGGMVTPLVIRMGPGDENPLKMAIQIADSRTAQVLVNRSPSVQVRDAKGEPIASIPISKNPTQAIYAGFSNVLYVLHAEQWVTKSKGPKSWLTGKVSKESTGHILSVVNLTELQVEREIQIGFGEASLHLAPDSRHLFVIADRGPSTSLDAGIPNPPNDPTVLLIDTASNEILSAHKWLQTVSAHMGQNMKRWNSATFISSTLTGNLILHARIWDERQSDYVLVVFHPDLSEPAFVVDVDGILKSTMLANDEKTLLAAIDHGKDKPSTILAIDLQNGIVIQTPLVDHPMRLIRLGAAQEPWVLGSTEMRALTEGGQLGDRRIVINSTSRAVSPSTTDSVILLDGVPGETLPVANGRVAVLINNQKHNTSDHRVALIDLEKLKVFAILPTMSSGEKAGIRTSRILGSALLMAVTMGLAIPIPELGFRNESLAAQPDGSLLYVLDIESHEVTVIDVQRADVVKRLQVNRTITRLEMSADGRRLVCLGSSPQQIDLEAIHLAM